jgi:hypothetical protein
MKTRYTAALVAVLAWVALPVHALTLSPDHLAAAESLSCVLAEDALGYLDEEQFNERFDASVVGFDEPAVDVIYAKALGYIDGLLFGVTSGAEGEAASRLEAYSASSRCSASLASRSVSL